MGHQRVIVARPMQVYKGNTPSVFAIPFNISDHEILHQVAGKLAKEHDLKNHVFKSNIMFERPPGGMLLDEHGCDMYHLAIQELDVIYD